jgi:hypothetical protein
MSNRHAHKKQTAEIRARMAKTGERYQTARDRILARSTDPASAVDLVPCARFGVPTTLAILSVQSLHWFAWIGHAPRSGPGAVPAPMSSAVIAFRPRGVN